MDTELRQKKRDIRKATSLKLAALIREEISRESRAAADILTRMPEWEQAKQVFLFLSMEKEIDTAILIERAIRKGKNVAVPRMYGKEIRFHRIPGMEEELFTRHSYGILEPRPDLPLQNPFSRESDLVVTPGMAFDRRGNRLGYGMGFYDRFFAAEEGRYTSIGICFSVQLIELIPSGLNDLPVHGLIAGNALIKKPFPG
jgi:5-formyltetrahydrofolate cyclo-ligase